MQRKSGPLVFSPPRVHTVEVDAGGLLFIVSRLGTGAAAAFVAIMLWSRTRDTAWMLMVIGVILLYVETVYSILEMFGVTGEQPSVGSVTAAAILLPSLRNGFFIAAFTVMVIRTFRRR